MITILITIDVTWLWCVQMQQNEMVGKVMDELKRKGMYSVNHQVRPTTSKPYAPTPCHPFASVLCRCASRASVCLSPQKDLASVVNVKLLTR